MANVTNEPLEKEGQVKTLRNRRQKIVVVFVVAILAVLFGYLCNIQLAGSRERCQANLRIIWKAAKLTGYGEGDRFPPSLQTIFTNAPDPKWYICPASGHNPGDADQIDLWSDYMYVSGLNESDPPSCVLAFCPPENHKGEGANVLFVDGSVRWYSVEEFKKLTSNPSLFFGVNDSNALDKLRSRTKILYPKH